MAMEQVNSFQYWGKARSPDGAAAAYHPLPWHCLDVAAVGVEILDRMPALRELFASRLGLDAPTLRCRIAFWLAMHDLGKFAESFQSQFPDNFEHCRQYDVRPNLSRDFQLARGSALFDDRLVELRDSHGENGDNARLSAWNLQRLPP
jgi:CRISPR-associated endonuclease/helicase Cas3